MLDGEKMTRSSAYIRWLIKELPTLQPVRHADKATLKSSTYKFKRVFFRHDRRTAPTFGTHLRIETRLALTKTKLTPGGVRGLFIDVCGMWHVSGWFVTWFKPVVDRKLLERLMSPSPKSQVMFASALSWIGDFFRIFGIHIFQVMASLVNLV